MVYGTACAIHLDPIEKKPFFHVHPGSTSLSVATAGCNFHCKFCQNWEISQASPEDVYSYPMTPEVVVQRAMEMGALSIAYTYVEPTIFYEYMFDIAVLAKARGLLNVFHSNGFINPGPLINLCQVIDAAQIDLKGFTNGFYRELCLGELEPVLETLKILRRKNVHLEITNLMIPTKNDDLTMVNEMCRWIKGELGSDVPLHFTRFYPLYKLRRLPPTPITTLEKARSEALKLGLEFVYIGNVPGHDGLNTVCPLCHRIVIERVGYMIRSLHLKDGKCAFCGHPLPGIWS